MAAIKITVKDDLYSIALDRWDWIGLSVNGTPVPETNGEWIYHQKHVEPLDFTATANYVTTLNTGSTFLMKGSSKDHYVIIDYSEPGVEPFTINGVCINVNPRPGAKEGPFQFSQGKMTGVFEKGQ